MRKDDRRLKIARRHWRFNSLHLTFWGPYDAQTSEQSSQHQWSSSGCPGIPRYPMWLPRALISQRWRMTATWHWQGGGLQGTFQLVQLGHTSREGFAPEHHVIDPGNCRDDIIFKRKVLVTLRALRLGVRLHLCIAIPQGLLGRLSKQKGFLQWKNNCLVSANFQTIQDLLSFRQLNATLPHAPY